jgi:uncharacterized Zn-finger protein
VYGRQSSLCRHLLVEPPRKCKSETVPRKKRKPNNKVQLKKDLKTCEFCAKVFSRNTGLENHRNLHLGLFPFRCNICWKAFQTQWARSKHKRGCSG